MLKSQAAAEKLKNKNTPLPSFMQENSSNASSKKSKKVNVHEEEEPPHKKKKVELVFEDELKAKEQSEAG